MKKAMLALVVLLLTAVSASALGEIGFAEVKKDSVNMRRAPSGKIIMRLDAAIRTTAYAPDGMHSACDVDHWEDVVQVAAGVGHTLGLKRDGTVYYARDAARHRAQVESWTDVVQIDAGNGYSIALRKDGSVVMAGAYTSYDR